MILPFSTRTFFRNPFFPETQKGSLVEISGTVRQIFFQQSCNAPFLCVKISNTRYFLKHRSVRLWSFSVLWQKFSTKPCEASTPSNLKCFRYKTVLEKQAFPYEVFHFGPVRPKKIDKAVMPPSSAWNFSKPDFFWNTNGFDYGVCRYCEKTFRWKLDSHLSSYPSVFFVNRNFLKHGKVPSVIFSAVTRNIFDGKWWTPAPFYPKVLDARKILKNNRVRLRSFSGLWEKCFARAVIRPLLSKSFSMGEDFWNTKRFPHEVFRQSESKKFWRKTVIPPPLQSWKYSIPKSFWKTETFPYEVFHFGPVR